MNQQYSFKISMMEVKKRVLLIIYGRVQMVGFRFFAQRTADSLGINGWVRNRSDGSVEIAAEGEEERLNRFMSIMRSGPPSASVSHVDIQWDPEIAETLTSFSVRW